MTLSAERLQELMALGKEASSGVTQYFPEVYGFELEQLCRMTLASDAMANGLTKISARANQTRLAKCCVEKTCHINEETKSCSFQTGVNYGYADQAADADDALKEADEIMAGKI